MISNATIKNFLTQVNDLERKMEDDYSLLADKLKNQKYKDFFRGMAASERVHIMSVKNILDALTEN